MALRSLTWICVLHLWMVTKCLSTDCPMEADCSCGYNDVICRVDNSSVPKLSSSDVGTRRLIIKGNRGISKLQEEGFNGLNIADLTISGTGMTQLICDAFKGLESRLKKLTLSNNFISQVSACVLRGLTKLEYLSLDDNYLTKLTAEMFPVLPALKYLFFGQNDISVIVGRPFLKTPRLEGLDLKNNAFTSAVWSTLNSSRPDFGGLKQLDLSGNRIEVVSTEFWVSLPSLNQIWLSNCSLTSFPWDDFALQKYFYTMDLSNNDLSNIGTDTTPVTLGFRGSLFNVSSNRLDIININLTEYIYSSNSRQILASNNRLSTAIVNVYKKTDSKTFNLELDFTGNQIESTLNVSLQTDSVANVDFTIMLDRNRINDVKAFPLVVKRIEYGEVTFWDPCSTSKSRLVNIDIIKLSLRENGIVNIDPRACLSVAEHVDVSENQLTKLDLISTGLEQRITTLNVSHNLISDVCVQNIDKTLSVLDLSDNLITEVPDFSSSLARKGFSMLHLTGNPVHCDCSIFWAKLGDFNSKMAEVLCDTPEDKVGQNMLSVDLFDCNPVNFQRITGNGCRSLITETEETYSRGLVIFLAVISCTLLVLSIVLAVILCLTRYRPKCLQGICWQAHNNSDTNNKNNEHVYEEATRTRHTYLDVSEGPPENVSHGTMDDGYEHAR